MAIADRRQLIHAIPDQENTLESPKSIKHFFHLYLQARKNSS